MSHPLSSVLRMDVGELYQIAESMGVTVVDGHPGMTRRGYYHHARRMIVIRPGLPARALVSVLAHELGHAHHGHAPTRDRRLHARHERQADEYAARLLIDEDEYRRAEAAYEGAIGPMANELGVTPAVMRAWRQTQSRGARRAGCPSTFGRSKCQKETT